VIIGKKITKSYSEEALFEEIDFKMGNGKKIGLVGANGTGKSTLFKLILGLDEPDAGSFHLEKVLIGYIPQEFDFPDTTANKYLIGFLENDWESYKIDILVDKLSFNNYDPEQKISTMSEGQKMKLKLIEVLLDEPDILLVDEPTNHLDIEGIQWFENYIKNIDETVALISHDRQFLNNVVDEIWEIEKKHLLRFVGNYDDYKEQKFNLIEKQGKEYRQFLQKKAGLERLLANARKKSDGKARGKAIRAAKKRMEREVEGENEKHKYTKEQMGDVKFQTDITHKRTMLLFDGVTKKYGKRKIFEDLSFSVLGGEKVWLFGPNGAGKTTIIKLIMGEEKPNKGNLKIGENVKVGYFAQKQSFLNYNKNLLDHYIEETGCPYGKAYGNLQKFLFKKNDLQKRVKSLSPGQRARFAFAIFAYNDYDFLVLDEPSNHLDIETKVVIEESLSKFKGTILLVSHDRFFVERVGVTKLLNLREGKLEYFENFE